jgi:glycosyltransferase involved in cell wall biosynthesis
LLKPNTVSTTSALLEPAQTPETGISGRGRRSLLFFLSSQKAYRRPLFSTEEVFCGPDAEPETTGGRIRGIKTAAGTYDVREVLSRLPSDQQPEFIVVKADASARNLPRNLACLPVPKVLLVGDTHHMGRPIQTLIRYAQDEPFDYVVFDHTRHHARFFAEAGIRNLHWLPALDYGFEPRDLKPSPSRPLTFVGQAGKFHPYRRWVLKQVLDAGLPLAVLRGTLSDTADLYADSAITLNISLNGDLNLRVFEALAAGGFLLTDELAPESGLRRLFTPGRHLETWRTPGELIEKIRHYGAHPAEARKIRAEGQAELFRNHHPSVKLEEFHRLIDGGDPNPRYDLRLEPWWPRGETVVSPGLPARIEAYEALQELHRSSARVAVYASDPAGLADLANLPRLEFLPLERLSPRAQSGGPAEPSVLWWDGSTPSEVLGKFAGDMILSPDPSGSARNEPSEWGFVRDRPDSSVWRLVHPQLHLQRSWAAGERETVRARLGPLISGASDATACVALSHFARLLGEARLQHAALRRAVGLDRDNAAALLSLAALTLEHGDHDSVAIMLEEASRLGPLPEKVDALRAQLLSRPGMRHALGFYWKATGQTEAIQADRPRRILVVTNIFPPQELGGYGRMMWEFAQGLAARGHEVRVLTADLPGLSKPPTPDEAAMESRVSRTLPILGEWRAGTPVVISDRSEIARRILSIRETVAAAIRDFGAEVVLAGNLDFLETLPIDVSIAAGVPVIHALGNATPGYGHALQPRSPLYCLAPSSDWAGAEVRRAGYSPPRVDTVYPGARVDRFFRFFPPDRARLRICFAGLVLPYKGPHVLIDALARLHRAGVDFTVEIAGDAPDAGFLEKLRKAIAATGIEGRVSFTGFLDRTGLAALFARNNVLVFPSQVPETFGISQVEAMAAGLVVVSSGTGGAREIIRDGVDGLLFTSLGAGDLAEKLYALARDPALFERLQHAAQARALTFAVGHSVSKIERLAEEMIGARAAG